MTQLLICPLDNSPLTLDFKTYKCSENHCFDKARQGYVNLLPAHHKRSKSPGDSKAMVLARQHFFESGAYQSIAKKVVDWTKRELENGVGSLLDAGCGEGYYLAEIEKQCPKAQLLGLDISKDAILSASKRSKAITWVVGSNRNIPLQPHSMDSLICMFGFPEYKEFKRVLKAQGKLLLVEAGSGHLIQVREKIYSEVRSKALPSLLDAESQDLVLSEQSEIKTEIHLNQEQLSQLLLMTPHFFRATPEGREALQSLTQLTVTLHVVFRTLVLA